MLNHPSKTPDIQPARGIAANFFMLYISSDSLGIPAL
jgi:hypothetical protein